MREDKPMNTSKYSNHLLAWQIFRYLLIQGALKVVKFVYWAAVNSVLLALGLLRLIGSPASSGRSPDEFQDMVRSDSPENMASRGESTDAFWRMYFQAYTPRAWRMRRLLTSVAKAKPKKSEDDDG